MRFPGVIFMLSLVACGDDALSGPDGLGRLGNEPTGYGSSGPGPSEEAAIAACADAAARERLDVHIVFEDPDRACAWDSDGNLSVRDRFLTARIEQPHRFALPEGSVICDLDMRFDEQHFRYDDHFLMHLDGGILAASFDFSPELGDGDVLTYDWTRVRGIQCFGVLPPRDATYCPGRDEGSSTCSFPPHDTPGRIELDVKPALIQEIMLRDTGRTNHELTFVTMGDNDPTTDCRHEPIVLDLSVSYALGE